MRQGRPQATGISPKGMTMTRNMGGIDRALRIIAGLLLLAFAITGVTGLAT